MAIAPVLAARLVWGLVARRLVRLVAPVLALVAKEVELPGVLVHGENVAALARVSEHVAHAFQIAGIPGAPAARGDILSIVSASACPPLTQYDKRAKATTHHAAKAKRIAPTHLRCDHRAEAPMQQRISPNQNISRQRITRSQNTMRQRATRSKSHNVPTHQRTSQTKHSAQIGKCITRKHKNQTHQHRRSNAATQSRRTNATN